MSIHAGRPGSALSFRERLAEERGLGEQAAPAVSYQASSSLRSCDKRGFRVTLALVGSALSGVVLGVDTASLLVIAIGLAAAVYGLRDPGVGLIGIGTLATVETVLGPTVLNGSTPLPFNTLNFWLALFCLLNVKLVFQLRQLQTKLHVLFLVVLAVGLVWSTSAYPTGVLQILSASAGLGLIFYFHLLPPSQRRMLVWVGICASAVASIFGLLQYQDAGVMGRFNANGMGTVQVNGLFGIFLATFSRMAKRREMNLLMFLAAANLGFAFLSGSRGAILTALITWLGTLAWGFSPQRKVVYAAASVALLLGFVSLYPGFHEYAMSRVERSFDSSRTLANRTSGRSNLALIGWYLFRENPVTGVGTGGYRQAMASFYRPDVRFLGYNKQAHSVWVQVLAENGAIGIVVLLSYVASFTWTGFLKRGRSGLLPVGLIASAVIALRFVSIDLGSLGVWWLAAGAIFLLHKPWPPPGRVAYAGSRFVTGNRLQFRARPGVLR